MGYKVNRVRDRIAQWLFAFVLFCTATEADYKCLCSYQKEAKILAQPTNTSKVDGYMYESDCRAYYVIPGVDEAYAAIGNENKYGYIRRTSDTPIQTCLGPIPQAQLVTTTPVPTTLPATKSTTTVTTTGGQPTHPLTNTNHQNPPTSNTTSSATTTLMPSTTITSTATMPTTITSPTTKLATDTSALTMRTLTTHPTTITTIQIVPFSTTPTTKPTTNTSPDTITSNETTTRSATPTSLTTKMPHTTPTTVKTTGGQPTHPLTNTNQHSSPTSNTATSANFTPRPSITINTTATMPTTSTTTLPTDTSTFSMRTITTHPTTITTIPMSTFTTRPTTRPTTSTSPTTITQTDTSTRRTTPTSLTTNTHQTTGVYNQADCTSLLRTSNTRHVTYNGRFCYEYVDKSVSWESARNDCRNRGGNLVEIGNAATNYYIYNFIGAIGKNCPIWIGLHAQSNEEVWIWDTGTPLSKTHYTNWMPSRYIDQYHTTEDCAILVYQRGGQWDDVDCDGHSYNDVTSNAYICQFNISALFKKAYCTSLLRNSNNRYMTDNGIFCYEYVDRSVSWEIARHDCRTRSGNLVEIASNAGNTFIYNFIGATGQIHPICIGLYDQSNKEEWMWDTGTPLGKTQYTNWMPSRYIDQYHVNDDCAIFVWNRSGQWDEVDCDGTGYNEFTSNAYICQFKIPEKP